MDPIRYSMKVTVVSTKHGTPKFGIDTDSERLKKREITLLGLGKQGHTLAVCRVEIRVVLTLRRVILTLKL